MKMDISRWDTATFRLLSFLFLRNVYLNFTSDYYVEYKFSFVVRANNGAVANIITER